jgi:hypothetical protein
MPIYRSEISKCETRPIDCAAANGRVRSVDEALTVGGRLAALNPRAIKRLNRLPA